MTFANVKSIMMSEGMVKQITSGGKVIWKAIEEVIQPILNLLPTATDTDRKTIYGGDYNGDGVNDGYRTGYRLSSSSGNPSSLSGMCCSGFISAKPGDILRIKGTVPKTGTASYVITYNSNNTKVAHQSIYQTSTPDWGNSSSVPWQSYADGVLTITLDSNFGTGFDSIRFSAGVIDANTVVTINQEITE